MKKLNYGYADIISMSDDELDILVEYYNKGLVTKACVMYVYSEQGHRRDQEGFNKCVLGIK